MLASFKEVKKWSQYCDDFQEIMCVVIFILLRVSALEYMAQLENIPDLVTLA